MKEDEDRLDVLKVKGMPKQVTLGSCSLVWSPARRDVPCEQGPHLTSSLLYLSEESVLSTREARSEYKVIQ